MQRSQRPQAVLTKHLHVVEDDSSAWLTNPIVSHAAIGAGVLLAGGVDEQVAEQEACLVVAGDARPIFGPGDLWWGDPAGHTLQDETLAFGDNNGLGLWGIDDASSLSRGAWKGEGGKIDNLRDQGFLHPPPTDPSHKQTNHKTKKHSEGNFSTDRRKRRCHKHRHLPRPGVRGQFLAEPSMSCAHGPQRQP